MLPIHERQQSVKLHQGSGVYAKRPDGRLLVWKDVLSVDSVAKRQRAFGGNTDFSAIHNSEQGNRRSLGSFKVKIRKKWENNTWMSLILER